MEMLKNVRHEKFERVFTTGLRISSASIFHSYTLVALLYTPLYCCSRLSVFPGFVYISVDVLVFWTYLIFLLVKS